MTLWCSGVFVALGSNLGDRAAQLASALDALAATSGVRALRCSRVLETAPVGGPPQPDYLNAVAELETALTPRQLFVALQQIEQRGGRLRGEINGPRTIDLDLLLFGDQRVSDADLRIPHPRMWQRAFVMEPLSELIGPAALAALRQRFGWGEQSHVR